MKLVCFLNSTLNPSPAPDSLVVSSFAWLSKIDTGEPFMLVLNVCINKEIAEAESPEFPVHIPASAIFHTTQHKELLRRFHSGEPFAMIRPINLRVHSCNVNGYNYYFGNADDFVVT